ncbi:MAG TPA: SRPBCC family protein [Miltoncostaeaceae bacterium]|nr:SRPBCC family protein [Miltoncostaeaceae bacterium]
MPSRPALLERSVEIAAPVSSVFAFHVDTRNAALISPAGTRVVGVEGRFPVRADDVVTLRMRRRLLPLTLTWRVRIESVEPERRIVDVAVRSPFTLWRHEHLFRALGPERTLLTDRVTYRLRGGRLGALAERLVVRRALEGAFAERHRRTREVLEGRAGASAGR